MHQTSSPLPGFFLAIITFILAIIVIGIGAYTRLKHAGLGCPDWPGCYGFFTVPETPLMLDLAQHRFPDAAIDIQKGWAEMIHRYVAGTLFLFVFILTALNFHYRKRYTNQPFTLSLFILGLLFIQAAFGMWTVTLKLWPQIVTFHLLGGYMLLSLIVLMMLRLYNPNWIPIGHYSPFSATRKVAIATLGIMMCQIAIGAWLSANYAALACPDFPLCQGKVWPLMDFSHGFNLFQSIGPNYLGGQLDNTARTAIHMTHRIGACISAGAILFLWYLIMIRHKKITRQVQGLSAITWLLLIMTFLQIALGIGNILSHFSLHVAVTHNIIGAFLLSTLLMLNYRLFYA